MSGAYNMNYTIIHIYLISIHKNDFQLQRHHLQSKQVDATSLFSLLLLLAEVESRMRAHDGIPPPPHRGMVARYKETVCDARAWIAMAVDLTSGPKVGLLNLHFFHICRHHPTLKFKPHATDDERYVWGIDGVPLIVHAQKKV